MSIAARSVTDELVLTRDIAAPRKRVFAAWTDARAASRWWVPQDCTPLSCEIDARPGGAWRRRMRAPDGTVIAKWGVYREVVAPERLVFTYRTERAGVIDSETLVTVTFADLGTRTRTHAAAYRVRDRRGAPRSPGRLERRPGAPDDVHRDGGSSAMSKTRSARLHDALAAHVTSGALPGLVALVSRRGKTQVEAIGRQSFESDTPMRRDTIFRIASMTKPITAAATLILVEQCKLRLDDPVDEFLPELANRCVLKSLEAPVDITVPAKRPISVRDLLTFTFGLGAVMVWPARHPIQKAMAEAGLAPGPAQPDLSADDFMKRLGSLPLIYQPGERWLYHTGADVLGVLIARASGQSFADFLRDHLFEPLGMRDTGFQVPADRLDRLASAYMMDPQKKQLTFFDDGRNSRWSRPPAFAAGGSGLVSTVDDFLAFYRMLLSRGLHGHERILSRPAVELMMSDQLTPEQRQGAELFFGNGASWGMGGAVVTRRTDLFTTPGRYGWDGGYGTSGHLDPAEDMVGILMTQRMMESPQPPRVFTDFWTSAYQSIDD